MTKRELLTIEREAKIKGGNQSLSSDYMRDVTICRLNVEKYFH